MMNDPEGEVARVLRAERFAIHEAFAGEQALQVFSDAVLTLEPGARARAERLAPDARSALVARAVDTVMDLGLMTHYAGSAEARVHAMVRRLVSVRNLQTLIDSGALAIGVELANDDIEFALRLVIDLLTHTGALVRGGVPMLKPPASTGSLQFDTLIRAGLRWALGAEDTEVRPWPAPVPLPTPWVVYDFRSMSQAWKELTIRETPEELARANIFILERSLTSV